MCMPGGPFGTAQTAAFGGSLRSRAHGRSSTPLHPHLTTCRLPGHTQALLSTAAGRKLLEIWPQYGSGGVMGPEATSSRRTQVWGSVGMCVREAVPCRWHISLINLVAARHMIQHGAHVWTNNLSSCPIDICHCHGLSDLPPPSHLCGSVGLPGCVCLLHVLDSFLCPQGREVSVECERVHNSIHKSVGDQLVSDDPWGSYCLC